MGYDAGRDTFTDGSTGESMGRDEARKRLDTILAGAKKQTTAYTERLGIRTVSRYGAAKSALEESLGRVVEGSDNRRPNLEPALYSRAVGCRSYGVTTNTEAERQAKEGTTNEDVQLREPAHETIDTAGSGCSAGREGDKLSSQGSTIRIRRSLKLESFFRVISQPAQPCTLHAPAPAMARCGLPGRG